MRMVSYDNVTIAGHLYLVREDREEYDRWPDYEALLDLMSKEFFKEKYALCLQITKGDEVVHEFPKVPCPALFLEQLKIRKI
ncbi:MAG: hypothetical protein JXR76_13705 [Deltaproteobacteria bacterium]|nr:hypothetical protein [Deltaproteobacteria bacterium]